MQPVSYNLTDTFGLTKPTNFFLDAMGNAGPVPAVSASSTGLANTPNSPINWGLWLSVAGVAFAALTYFKGR